MRLPKGGKPPPPTCCTRSRSDEPPASPSCGNRRVPVMDLPPGDIIVAATGSEADDKFHDECGVFGVWNTPDAAAVTALGLHALQHRGQEATGIVTYDSKRFHSHRGL